MFTVAPVRTATPAWPVRDPPDAGSPEGLTMDDQLAPGTL